MDDENTLEHALQMIMYGYPEWSQRTSTGTLWLKAYGEVLKGYSPEQVWEGHRLYCSMVTASTPPSAYYLADMIEKWGTVGKADAPKTISIMPPWRRAKGKSDA